MYAKNGASRSSRLFSETFRVEHTDGRTHAHNLRWHCVVQFLWNGITKQTMIISIYIALSKQSNACAEMWYIIHLTIEILNRPSLVKKSADIKIDILCQF